MYELIILSLLMRHPMHGYLIARIINDIIGPAAKISNGALYPLLARLEQTGLIGVASALPETPAADRHARTLMITEAGRTRFHQLMMDTAGNPGDYQRIFRYKVAHLYLVQPHERLHLIDHYIHYCRTHVLYYQAEAENLVYEHAEAGHLEADAEFLAYTADMMEQQIRQWQSELDWALRLRNRESARMATETTP